MKKTYSLEYLDCAVCAAKMEAEASRVPGVEKLRVDFVRKTMILAAPDDRFHDVFQEVAAACRRVEPSCEVREISAVTEGKNKESAAGHGHDHGGHGGNAASEGEAGEGARPLLTIGVGAALFVAGILLPAGAWRWATLIAAYLVAGGEVLWRAVKNILRGQVFDENFLMAVASLGAMLMGDATEAVAVMLFYQIGEWFQDRAVDKSRASIAHLLDIRPDHANHVLADGRVEVVPPQTLQAGDILLVKPGERVPLDGVIVEGHSTLNTSALTGESLPRDVGEGDTVLSGCVNQTGVIRLRATGGYEDSTVARILRLVEDSGERKARTERFITRFARWYTPAVCIAAALLAVIPPLFVGDWMEWVRRALTFLVISCPCALVISVPLTFFGGVGCASRRGVLIKGANYLELLAKTGVAVFDKTGTLTRGTFQVTAVHPNQVTEEELLELAALAESYSDHPISASLRAAWNRALDQERVTDVREIAGRGIHARVDGRMVYAGNERLMADVGVPSRRCHHAGTIVHVAADGAYMGHIVIADQVKQGAAQAVAELKALGVQRTVMLTGDQESVAQSVGKTLGVDEIHAELLPADKVAQVERLTEQKPAGTTLAFVGDGINDAPVLRRADLGIAMGGVGSDAAIEAADIVIMDDDPAKLPYAIRIARRTMGIAKQNIVFALGIKGVILALGACGLANMWLAVFADVGVSFLAILNAMRAMRVK